MSLPSKRRFGVIRLKLTTTLVVLTLAPAASASPNPALVWRISQQVFGVHARTAYCIARYESGYDPRAVSPGGGNWGLFQINTVHRGWVDFRRVLDPWYNARVAYRLSHGGTNWGPWSTRRLCGV